MFRQPPQAQAATSDRLPDTGGKRLVQRDVVDRVAKAELEWRVTKGGVVKIDVKDDMFVIEPGPNREATQARSTASSKGDARVGRAQRPLAPPGG